MHLSRWAVVTLVFFLVIGGAVTAAADGEYELSMDTAVDVPERTVENPENESEEFTITTVGRATPGENALVSVSPPSNTRYSAYFREENGDIVDFADRIQGDQQVEFSVGSEPAGSYVITAGETSAPDAVLPVVIEGYVVDALKLDGSPLAGATISADSTHNVTVELTNQSDLSASKVTLTLWVPGDGVMYETSLAKTEADATTYNGTIEDLDAGEYNAQVRIQGGETVNGEAELIGLSDNQQLTVESHSSDNEDGTDDSSSTGDGSGSDTDADGTTGGDSVDDPDTNETDTGGDSGSTTNGTDTTNSTDGSSNNSDSDGSSTDDSGDSDSDGPSADDSGDSDSDGSSTDDSADSQSPNGTDDSTSTDGVIEPNTNNSNSNTNDSTPLYVVPLVLALVVVTALTRRLLDVLHVN